MKALASARMRTALVALLLMLVPLLTVGNVHAAAGSISSCTGCHGNPPVDNATGTRDSSAGTFAGNHTTHAFAGNCTKCHNSVGATEYNHSFKSNVAGVNYINMTSVINQSPKAGAKYGSTKTIAQTGTGLTTCANVNCHFEKTTPAWGQTGSNVWSSNSTANCDQCHVTGSLGSKHSKHLSVYGSGLTTCAKCHPDHGSLSGTAAFKHATSATRPITVTFAGAPTGSGAYGVTGNAGRTGQQYLSAVADGTCSSTYCHSSGKSGVIDTNAEPSAPTWNTTFATPDCKSCHGAKDSGTGVAFTSVAGEPNYVSSGSGQAGANSHGKHVGSVLATAQSSCKNCHRLTTSNGTTILAGSVNHVDGSIDTRFKRTDTFTSFSGVYNKTSRTCSATYCHGGAAPVWGNNNTLTCSSCHSSKSGDTGFSNNAHKLHVGTAVQARFDVISGNLSSGGSYRFGCAVCHDPSRAAHGQGGVSTYQAGQVFFRYTTAGKASVAQYIGLNATTGTDNSSFNWTAGGSTYCNNTYCHSNGRSGASFATGTNVTWNTSASTGACNICHGNATTGSLSAPHASHLNNASILGTGQTISTIGCVDCHAKTVSSDTNVNNKALHINKMKDYSGVRAGKSSTYSTAGGCTASYCHSSGKKGVYAGVTEPGQVYWNSATLDCAGCHGSTGTFGAPTYTSEGGNKPGSNSHALTGHVSAATDCIKCHRKTVNANGTSLRNYSSLHLDKNLSVYFSNAATYNGNKTCSSTTCHGTSSPAWGVSTSSVSCTKCHGKPTTLGTYSSANAWQAAPGYATTGIDTSGAAGSFTNGVSNDPQVGAHDAHLRAVNQYTDRKVLCTDCHTVPGTAGHANGTTDFNWSNLAKNTGTSFESRGVLSPGYSGGQCTNMYCHGDGNTFVSGGGTYNNKGASTTPSWTDQAYLTTYTKDVTTCGKCHAARPVVAKKDHSGVAYTAGSCNTCHGHDGNGPKHIDGTLQAAGDCNGCHDYDVTGATWNASTGRYNAGTGSWGKNLIDGAGAHVKHINFIKARLYGADTTLDPTNQNFGQGVPKMICGTCHTNDETNEHTTGGGGTRRIDFGGPTPTYTMGYGNGNQMTLLFVSGTNPSYNSTARTCSNLSCHYFTSPAWR